MKTILLLLLPIWLVGCTNRVMSEVANGNSVMNQIPNQSSTPPRRPDDLILSNEYSIADGTLKRAILEEDYLTLQEGLRSQFTQIQIEAVEALCKLDDVTSVPKLAEALQNNQRVISGGTETQILHNSLTNSIVFALEHLTGLEFTVSRRLSGQQTKRFEPLSQDEIGEILAKIKKWNELRKASENSNR